MTHEYVSKRGYDVKECDVKEFVFEFEYNLMSVGVNIDNLGWFELCGMERTQSSRG